MADGIVQVPPDSTGKKVDAASLDVGANTVMRQRVVIGDNSASAQFATVTGGALLVTVNAGTNNIGAVSNAAGTALMGAVSLAAGTANIGMLDSISRTVQVAIGTPFTINNISQTVSVVNVAGTANIGAVSLGAGTAVIGDLNAISRTVQVAIGTPFTIDAISRTATVVVGGFLDASGQQRNLVDSANLALRVNVVAGSGAGANPVSIAAGTANIGFLDSISRTVQVAVGTPFTINNISATVLVAGSLTIGGMIDNTTYSTGVTTVSPAGYIFFSASATAVTDGRVAAGRITDARGQHVNLRNNAGAEVGIAAAPLSVKVENTSATASVVLAAGTANIGTLNNISQTVSVILAAGTANFGTLNDISRTVSVVIAAGTANIGAVSNAAGTALMGAVSLAAGTANIGFINNISATVNTVVAGFLDPSGQQRNVVDSANTALRVNVVAGAAGGVSQVDGTSFTSQAANFVPVGGIFDDVSTDSLSENDAGVVRMTSKRAIHVNLRDSSGAEINYTSTAAVSLAAGTNNIGAVSLAAGTTNIGFINNISATVTCVVNGFTPAIMSASHGPKCVTASTSANVTLITGPGAGLSVYITQLAVSNAGATGSRARIGTSASATTIVMFCASAGGGFVMNFDPPWKLSASEAAVCSVKPNTADMLFNVNFFVAA